MADEDIPRPNSSWARSMGRWAAIAAPAKQKQCIYKKKKKSISPCSIRVLTQPMR
jgi:hypothetical protein